MTILPNILTTELFSIWYSYIGLITFCVLGDDDYDSGPYTVTFPSGVTNVSFDIMISDNNQPESDETFYLIINSFSLPHNITITDLGQATVIILDDDCKLH